MHESFCVCLRVDVCTRTSWPSEREKVYGETLELDGKNRKKNKQLKWRQNDMMFFFVFAQRHSTLTDSNGRPKLTRAIFTGTKQKKGTWPRRVINSRCISIYKARRITRSLENRVSVPAMTIKRDFSLPLRQQIFFSWDRRPVGSLTSCRFDRFITWEKYWFFIFGQPS